MHRPRRFRLDCLSHPVARDRMGSLSHICHPADHAQRPIAGRFGRDL